MKLTPQTDNLCCICGDPIEGYGNNAEPVCAGRCCDSCNIKIVLPARIIDLTNQRQINMDIRPSTTFHLDFRIAEAFGIEAVKDTFNRAFQEWRTNYLYLTEFVIVLNHRCWMHYDRGNHELSKLYADYYHQAHDWACENLKGEEFEHYFSVTD